MTHEVPLSNLSLNPKLACVPTLHSVSKSLKDGGHRGDAAEVDADIAALHESLDRLGIQEPLKAHRGPGDHWIVDDGRHRLQWAYVRGSVCVPVVEVSAEQGEALIEATVIGRRHWTKGQRAYLGVMLHPEVATGEKRGGDRAKPIQSVLLSAPALAERLGTSPDTVQQACELYRKFHAPDAATSSPEAIEAAALREKYEMAIWSGAGLGAVLAGIGGGESTVGKPRPAPGFQGLDRPLASLTSISKLWTKWSDDERSKAHKLMVARFREAFTPDFRLALSEALAAAES
jgi:hypothetical protein